MKFAAVLLMAAPVWCQAPLKVAAVNPPERSNAMQQVFSDLEKRLDNKVSAADAKDPIDLLGLTRGLYLQGYGAVFTTEASLIITPTLSPFRQQITKDDVVKVHQRKIEHLATLKKAMRDMWIEAAASLTAIPDTEQLVLAMRLLYQPWEDTKGLPGQIVMKGPRRAAVTGNIQTEEQ
ncbi:MAG: hypothetical protein C5B51_25530 [Terriglobia bacterium]|nr:MAG: hypothetical protein C5B51_25530 [Terriglobia bacterium]